MNLGATAQHAAINLKFGRPKKIQGLLRSKGWRESYRSMPIHAGDDSFLYPIPETGKEIELAPGFTAILSEDVPKETVDAFLEMVRLARASGETAAQRVEPEFSPPR